VRARGFAPAGLVCHRRCHRTTKYHAKLDGTEFMACAANNQLESAIRYAAVSVRTAQVELQNSVTPFGSFVLREGRQRSHAVYHKRDFPACQAGGDGSNPAFLGPERFKKVATISWGRSGRYIRRYLSIGEWSRLRSHFSWPQDLSDDEILRWPEEPAIYLSSSGCTHP
jgi:hypothetical protein